MLVDETGGGWLGFEGEAGCGSEGFKGMGLEWSGVFCETDGMITKQTKRKGCGWVGCWMKKVLGVGVENRGGGGEGVVEELKRRGVKCE